MTYTEYYTSKEAIKAADTITREAFVVVCTLYEPHWGWKDHLNCMTEDKLPIVYAFNIAETIKRRIVSSTNHISTIKEETNLLHLFSKNNFTSINWAYQQNTILGILCSLSLKALRAATYTALKNNPNVYTGCPMKRGLFI